MRPHPRRVMIPRPADDCFIVESDSSRSFLNTTPMLVFCSLLCIPLCLLSLLLFSENAIRLFHAEDKCVPMNTLDFIDRRAIENDSIPVCVRDSRSVHCGELGRMIPYLLKRRCPIVRHGL